MTKAIVTPIRDVLGATERETHVDGFGDLLTTIADLAVGARRERERLERLTSAGDPRVVSAIERLAELERHAFAVGVEAAGVRSQLQQARLL